MKTWFIHMTLASILLLPIACLSEVQNTSANSDASSATPSQKPVLPDEVTGQAPVQLYFSSEQVNGQEVTVDVMFFREDNRPAPRMAEIHLKTSANLAYGEVRVGEAAQSAQKDVIGQVRPGHQVRLSVFSSANLNTLNSGVLAQVVFEVLNSDAEEAQIEFVPSDAILAPAESGEGLELGNPLVINF